MLPYIQRHDEDSQHQGYGEKNELDALWVVNWTIAIFGILLFTPFCPAVMFDFSWCSTLQKAREQSVEHQSRIPFETLNWLGFTMMLSELGRKKELNDLLDYADNHLNPQWVNGGLYYPRNDKLLDDEWNLIHIEPHSGDSVIGYARLNVENGQKKMWEKPWTHDNLANRPFIDSPRFDDDVDFLRGTWDDNKTTMVTTLKRWQGISRPLTLRVKNLPKGPWGIYVNGMLKESKKLSGIGEVQITKSVGQDPVDFVIKRA